jgi:hypothetical protein
MKRVLLAAAAVAALVSLGACADDYYGPRHGPGFYEHHPVAYDGFYDGYYGTVYDGYWGDGGYYYSMREGGPYLHDDGGHFRQDAGPGFNAFHGGMHRGG